jgi:hypothetical protein
MNGPGDFERELERELHRILDPIAAAPIPLRKASSGAMARRLLGGAGVALGLKLATGVAIAAFAAAAIGTTTEVAVTGSLNPADWGRQVKSTVADCKAKLAAGQHGIGDCVSDFATQHGDLVSDQHSKGKSGTGGTTGGSTNGSDNGKTDGSGNGHKPTPAPGKSGTHTPQAH